MNERYLLIQLCKHSPPPHLRERIAAERDQIEWTKFCELARQHDLLPLVHKNLESLGLLNSSFLPAEAITYIENRRYASVMRNTLALAELERIADRLGKDGIPVLVLKGPVLAERIYGDVSLRPFTDLDFVIHPRHRQDAGRCLVRLGYRHMRREDEEEDYYLQELGGREGRRMRSWIDIHHRMGANMRLRGRRFDMEEIWRDSTPFRSETCRRPCWEDFLCHLATHASLDSYPRFILVCDVDRVVRACEEMDWRRLLDKAARYRCKTDLWIALRLAALMLDTPVAPNIADRIKPGALWRKVIERFVNERNIFEKRAGSLTRLPFRLATTDRLTEIPDALWQALRLLRKGGAPRRG